MLHEDEDNLEELEELEPSEEWLWESVRQMRRNEVMTAFAADLQREAARQVVDMYCAFQKFRIGMNNRIKGLERHVDNMRPQDEAAFAKFYQWFEQLEGTMAAVLEPFSQETPVGKWQSSICGIGPIMGAGLRAYIDITRSPKPSNLWRYAGLDPTAPLAKRGETRCWNGRLKTLCWKIGQSFVKLQNNPACVYGQWYLRRLSREVEVNEQGLLAGEAEKALRKTWSATSKSPAYYKQGVLPPWHLKARAQRWTVKLFLSHWHQVAWESTYPIGPYPYPYVLSQLGHTGVIMPPNFTSRGVIDSARVQRERRASDERRGGAEDWGGVGTVAEVGAMA